MGTKRDPNQRAAHGITSIALDDLDTAILQHLESNGRATNYEVGEALGL